MLRSSTQTSGEGIPTLLCFTTTAVAATESEPQSHQREENVAWFVAATVTHALWLATAAIALVRGGFLLPHEDCLDSCAHLQIRAMLLLVQQEYEHISLQRQPAMVGVCVLCVGNVL